MEVATDQNRAMTLTRTLTPTLFALALTLTSFTAIPSAHADQDRVGASNFVRIVNDERGTPVHLQVAVASYSKRVGDRDIAVDLVGAVHVGDLRYYQQLNTDFRLYDAVLFELIAPENATITPGQEHDSVLSSLQMAMKNGLSLSYQLDEIDYRADNFVHADLTPEQFGKSLVRNTPSPMVAAWQAMSFAIREGARSTLRQSPRKMIKDLTVAPEDRMKVLFARELASVDQVPGLFGNDETSAIIGARNAKAVEVLAEQIETGKNRLAIFYGAAHLPDLQRRLLAEQDFSYESTQWLNAWLLQAALAQ
ncbi:MAG: hypothetical protein AAGA84_05450 [Pseudomonadota bacterium]